MPDVPSVNGPIPLIGIIGQGAQIKVLPLDALREKTLKRLSIVCIGPFILVEVPVNAPPPVFPGNKLIAFIIYPPGPGSGPVSFGVASFIGRVSEFWYTVAVLM